MANRAEVNRLNGIDSPADPPGRGAEARPGDARLATTRRIRSWARCTTRRAGSSATTPSSGAWPAAPTRRRGDPPLHRGHRVRAVGRAHHGGAHEPRHGSSAGTVVNCDRGLEHADRRHGRRPAADHHAHPPGVRDRAGQAAARRRDRLLADARLHLADRPRRVRDGVGDRAVDDVPDERHAQLPPGPHAPHAGAVPAARACADPARVGRPLRPEPGLLADPRRDRGRRTSTSARAGAPTASRPRRSSAARWPS